MKKVLLGLGAIVLVGSVFALSVADLETQLNNIYNA
jgi:xanthosine utilization system XapX-like protein